MNQREDLGDKRGGITNTVETQITRPLFSKRIQLANLAREWCELNGAPVNPFNIVTALSALGYLTVKASSVPKPNEKQ